MLKQNFPDLTVVGENYPPSDINLSLHTIVTLIKFVTLGLILAGPQTFHYLGRNPPGWYQWTQENKVK